MFNQIGINICQFDLWNAWYMDKSYLHLNSTDGRDAVDASRDDRKRSRLSEKGVDQKDDPEVSGGRVPYSN
jgi:hypothetical protein